jgi:hypothetical protein
VKRGLAGRTRRGAPPLRRQRAALRVVQLTLLALAVGLAVLAVRAWSTYSHPPPSLDGRSSSGLTEVAVLAALSTLSAAGALSIGVRTVRGPEGPTLD